MVLKVVRGKILETLELLDFRDASGSVLGTLEVGIFRSFPFKKSVLVKLSKIR